MIQSTFFDIIIVAYFLLLYTYLNAYIYIYIHKIQILHFILQNNYIDVLILRIKFNVFFLCYSPNFYSSSFMKNFLNTKKLIRLCTFAYTITCKNGSWNTQVCSRTNEMHNLYYIFKYLLYKSTVINFGPQIPYIVLQI